MTCREKLKIEHPECVRVGFGGGCRDCPHDYGYLDRPDYCKQIGYPTRCEECWDREIPEQIDTRISYDDVKTLKDVLNRIEFGDRHEGKSVCELLDENAKLSRMLESKNGLIGTLKEQLRKTQDELSAMNKSYYEMEDDLLRRLSKVDREARLYRHLNDILSDRLKDLGGEI